MKRELVTPGRRIRHILKDNGPRSQGVILAEPVQGSSRHWYAQVKWDSGVIEDVMINRLQEA